MPEIVTAPVRSAIWEAPPVPPLDEDKWQAWVQRGRAHDRRNKATRLMVVKGISIATLLVGAGLWLRAAPYEVALLAVLMVGSLFVMSQAVLENRIAFAAIFAGLAILYNPAAPLLHSFDGWERAVMVASTIPFALSLAWRREAERTTVRSTA